MALKYSSNYKMAHTQYCSAPTCHNSRGKCPTMSFFGFPKDKLRCEKWVENCKRPDLNNVSLDQMHRSRVLCSVHFEDSQFMNAKARNRLIWTAIPTIFKVPNQSPNAKQTNTSDKFRFNKLSSRFSQEQGDFDFPKENNESTVAVAVLEESLTKEQADEKMETSTIKVPITISTQVRNSDPSKVSIMTLPKNTYDVSTVVMNPQQLRKTKVNQLINRQRVRLWRLKKQVEALKSKVPFKEDTVEDIIRGASKYISGIAFSFFSNQLRIASKKKRGKRWTKDDKLFALSLNIVSAEAYHLCSKVFSLPTLRTLKRWQQCFRKQPNFEQLELNPFKDRLLGKITEKQSNNGANGESITADDQLILDALNQCLNPTVLDQVSSSVGDEESSEKQVVITKAGINEETAKTVKKPSQSTDKNCSSKRKDMIPRILSTKKAWSTMSTEEQEQLQFEEDSNQIDPHTLKLIANVSNIMAGTNKITAIRETNSEGTMMLTPITDSIPITLSEDIVNLEIVTLEASEESVNVLRFT